MKLGEGLRNIGRYIRKPFAEARRLTLQEIAESKARAELHAQQTISDLYTGHIFNTLVETRRAMDKGRGEVEAMSAPFADSVEWFKTMMDDSLNDQTTDIILKGTAGILSTLETQKRGEIEVAALISARNTLQGRFRGEVVGLDEIMIGRKMLLRIEARLTQIQEESKQDPN